MTEKTENVWTESNPLYVWACPTRQEDGVQPVVDHNAAINILEKALGTVGHTGTRILDPNASGDLSATETGVIQSQQLKSMNEESPRL